MSKVIADRYQLTREIGRGGMGMVWEGFDRVLERVVALKFVKAEFAEDRGVRRRFEREARNLARLKNPHIVDIYDYGIDDGSPYIVMELLAGEDLHVRLRREGRQTPAAVLEFLRQLASGLMAAAAVAIVHRDLKPANVFFARSGNLETVKLLDFGVALSSVQIEPGAGLAGTPLYMSPEQLRGLRPQHVGDLWSTAVIAYRALTDRLPFSGETFSELAASVCSDDFPPASSIVPGLPPGIDDFFARGLAKDPGQRFQTASELVQSFSELCRTSAVKILVVDDEPDVATMIKVRFRRQIRDSTHQFSFASDGEDALAQLRRDPDTDVILADINMPVMDGLTLLEHIPQICPVAKTVMVSAYGNMPNIRRAMNAGAFDFVVKPINFEDLSKTIDKAAREVSERRGMVNAEGENQVLRKFVNSVVAGRVSGAVSTGAFPREMFAGTVVMIELRPGTQEPIDPQAAANASFEIIIPELLAHGGEVISVSSTSVMAVYSGADQLLRALDACQAVRTQHWAVSHAVGVGLAMSVDSGELVLDCVGSHVCGRLAYTLIGDAVDYAARLLRLVQPGEVLVGPGVTGGDPWPHLISRDVVPVPAEAPVLLEIAKLEVDAREAEASAADLAETEHDEQRTPDPTLTLDHRAHAEGESTSTAAPRWGPGLTDADTPEVNPE